MKNIKKFFKTIGIIFVTLLTGYNKEAIDAGAVDLSGQGRDKYGR